MSERIWNILIEGFGKIMLASIQVTIPLTILGFGFAMVIAMFMALVQYARVPVLRQFSRIYIWIFRGTPLLVQLFLAYYGFPRIGIVLNSFVCAVIVFSLNEGAYCAEIMRSALEAVPGRQIQQRQMKAQEPQMQVQGQMPGRIQLPPVMISWPKSKTAESS